MQQINKIAQPFPKNEHYTSYSFEILKFKKSCNLIGREHLVYKLRTRFSPDMQFSQNHIAKNGSSSKAQKVILPPLSVKYSAFCPNLSCLPDYLDNKYNFPKSGFVTF